MSALFQKLNLKEQNAILVLDAPESFAPELAALAGVQVHRSLVGAGRIEFAMAFVTTLAGVEAAAHKIAARADGDVILWMVYPKQTSRRYTCEFHRDTGWKVLEALEFESVRMVAVDEDWSALRFRRSRYVRKKTPRTQQG